MYNKKTLIRDYMDNIVWIRFLSNFKIKRKTVIIKGKINTSTEELFGKGDLNTKLE